MGDCVFGWLAYVHELGVGSVGGWKMKHKQPWSNYININNNHIYVVIKESTTNKLCKQHLT